MTSIGSSWKDFLSLKFLSIGLFLLLVGGLGFAYYYGQSPPIPVEQISKTPLPEKKVKNPDYNDYDSTHSHIKKHIATKKVTYTTYTTKKDNEKKEIIPPTINILNPSSNSTFAAPAKFNITTVVLPGDGKIEKVEFFYSRISAQSLSIYNTIKNIQIPNAPLIKIGEVKQPPYSFDNAELEAGVRSIYAIVTDEYGIRQISSPKTIIINEYLPKKNDLLKYSIINNEKDIGWLPAIIYSETNSTNSKCMELAVKPSAEVNSIDSDGLYTSEGQKVTFKVSVKSPNQFEKFKYAWRTTVGELVQGQNTDSIIIDTDNLGGQTLIATVQAESETGCTQVASGEVHILQKGEAVTRENSFKFFNPKTRLAAAALELSNHPDAKLYIITYGGEPFCKGEAENLGKFAKNYLIELGLEENQVVTIDGGFTETSEIKIRLVPVGAEPPQPDKSMVTDSSKIMNCSPDRLNSKVYPPPVAPYKKCPDISEKLNFFTKLYSDLEGFNICPFNNEDPINSTSLKTELTAQSLGIFGNPLIYEYSTNGGIINSNRENAVWDLNDVKLMPGTYTAILQTDDGCDSKNTTAQSVHITNYCTPCFTGASFSSNSEDIKGTVEFSINVSPNNSSIQNKLNYSWSIPQGTILAGQGSNTIEIDTGWNGQEQENETDKSALITAVEINGVKRNSGILSFSAKLLGIEKPLTYDWTVSDSKGVFLSGQKTNKIDIDTSQVRDETITLIVKISGFNLLFFTAKTPSQWAIEKSLSERDLTYEWKVDKGTIISGQGTNKIAVDTADLPYETKIKASVKVNGIREYCINEDTVEGIVGFFRRPTRVLVDEFGSLLGSSEEIYRRARRKNQNNETTTESKITTDVENGVVEDENPPNPSETPKADEKEFVKIEWSKEPVQIQQAFSIIVTYNRVKESLDIVDTTGQVVAELKSEDIIQLIKDRWGKDYIVWAHIRLQSAGLYQSDTITCSPNCQTDFLSLNAREQKWTFNVTARNAGVHTFNIEMWIEGRHKETNLKTSSERIWGMENLKVTVREDVPTKNQLFFSSGLLCLLGFVFAARGINFKGIKIIVAGGNIAGRDMAGGNIIHGDNVSGNKANDPESVNDDISNDKNKL